MSRSAAPTLPAVKAWPAWLAEPATAGAWLTVLAGGAVLGGVSLILPALLADGPAFALLAVLVAMIAGVYLGFALSDGRLRAAMAEELGIVLFAVLATVALVTQDGAWLAAGLFGHALWDALHHRWGIDTVVPRWYVPLCVGYDVVVGLYALLRF